MQTLFTTSERKARMVKGRFRRFLLDRLDGPDRLVGVKGARGSGKTTLLLQDMLRIQSEDPMALYVTLDDLYFQKHTVVGLVEQYYLAGGRTLYIDEVHKYPNWSVELKNVYDTYADLRVVFTSSSILEIHRGDADLSRRAVVHELPGMSFREYLELQYEEVMAPLPLEDILHHHVDLARELSARRPMVAAYREYMRHGHYPYFREGVESYHQKLMATINLILEVDVPAIEPITYATVHKLKRLLVFIASSVPFKPNVAEMARLLDTKARVSVLELMDTLHRARLIALLRTSAGGKGALSKPDKVYLDNGNLIYALGGDTADMGNMRETFFYNQLRQAHEVLMSPQSDFLVDGTYTFEVGGKNKGEKQIQGLDNAYIASDDIEIGFANRIPLWMFGLMY